MAQTHTHTNKNTYLQINTTGFCGFPVQNLAGSSTDLTVHFNKEFLFPACE